MWTSMPAADQRHSIAVAKRAVQGARSSRVPVDERDLVAAALLHDVGKTGCALGTAGRVAATVAAWLVGHRTVAGWSRRGGWRARAACFADHQRIGAQLLREAGARPLAVAWAASHHRDLSDHCDGRLGVPPAVARLLAAADGD
ncbi:MAG: HD domain-containing protein [Actinomycetota bacterium]|nr:HD domain-containing protein [Actinomycetota bacterium]